MAEIDKRNDGELLAAVAFHGEQDCFAELVRRHGPMVLDACRRQLGERHDAEDAAQAVFLVLWQKAGGLRRRASIAGWLHHVAANICRNLRRAKTVRKQHERAAAERCHEPDGRHHEEWNRIKEFLDDELDALPEKYRTPVVLFHLEGRSLEETGALLRMKTSTLTTRLQRGRDMLRRRLARRGISISSAAFAGLLSENVATAGMPLFFAETTAKAASLYALGQPAAGSIVSAQTIALTKGALDMLSITKIKVAMSIMIATILIAGGGSFFMWQSAASPAPMKTAAISHEVPAVNSQTSNGRTPLAKQAAKTQPAVVDLGHERIQFEKHETDNLPGKLFSVGLYTTLDLPNAKSVYEKRLKNKIGNGYNELVGRLPNPILYGPTMVPVSFTRSGKNITAKIRCTYPKGNFTVFSYYFRARLPLPTEKAALPPGKYNVRFVFEDYYTTNNGVVVKNTDRKGLAIPEMTCTLTVPNSGTTQLPNERTPIKKLEKHIAWGKPGKNGLQVGVVLDPHKDSYTFGEVARCRFFYRNAGNEKLKLTPPKLLEARVTKLHVNDDRGNPIPVMTKSDKEPLWIVGAYVVTLDPGEMTEVHGSSLAVGKGNEDDALTNVVKARLGQTCRLYFTLNDYTSAVVNPLDTGKVQFEIAAGNGIIKQLKSRKERGTLRDIYEKITPPGNFSKRDELSRTYPLKHLPGGDKAGMLSEWFDKYKNGGFTVTTNDNNWLLFRSKQLDQLVRMWIRRIERKGNAFVIHMTRSIWIGSYTFNVRYHDVFGVNLGKLPAGKYHAKWIIDEASHMKYDKMFWPIDDAVVKPNAVVLSTDFSVVAPGNTAGGQDAKPPEQNGKPVKGLKLTLSADKSETVMKADGSTTEPVKLKLTFTNTGKKPIKLDAHGLPFFYLTFEVEEPAPGSIKKSVFELDIAFKPPTPKDFPVIQPGQSWSPDLPNSFPGDIAEKSGLVSYAVRKPGIYKLCYIYDYPKQNAVPLAEGAWTGRVASNQFALQVKAFGAKASKPAKKPAPKNPSLSLEIATAKWSIDRDITFTCTFHNPTAQDIRIPGWGQMDYPTMLEIRDENAKVVYVDGGRDRLKKISMAEAYPHIKAGQSHQFTLIGKLDERRRLTLPELLGGWWFWHKLVAGKYTVRAIIDTTQSEKHLALAEKGLGFKVWRGRVVSDPVTIEIPKTPVLTMHRWPGYGPLGNKTFLDFIVYNDGTFRYKNQSGTLPQMAIDHLQQKVAKANTRPPTDDAETLTFRWWDEQAKEHETVFTNPLDRKSIIETISKFAKQHATKSNSQPANDAKNAGLPNAPQNPPNIPILVKPEPGAELDNGRTDIDDSKVVWDFSWKPVQGAGSYQLQVFSPRQNKPSIDQIVKGTQYRHIQSGTYAHRFRWQWRVRAIINGKAQPWSELRTFDVKAIKGLGK